MSRYPDDNYDDRDDDRRDDDREPRDNEHVIQRAKSAVMAPAIGLIVVAAFGLIAVLLGFVQYATLDAQFDEQNNQIRNNPQIPANQKQDQINMMNKIRDYAKIGWLPYYGLVGLFSLVTLVGGIKLMSLSSPGLVKFGAVLALLPCVSGCCILGLVFGIWAFVVLGKPEVKAGFAARNRSRY